MAERRCANCHADAGETAAAARLRPGVSRTANAFGTMPLVTCNASVEMMHVTRFSAFRAAIPAIFDGWRHVFWKQPKSVRKTMRILVPRNDSTAAGAHHAFTPKGEVTVTVDDSHHWVDIALPEGVQEDEVDVYSCFLDPDHRPPYGCGPALLQAATRQLADDTSAIADAASPLGGDPPASDDAAAPASPADDTSASAGDAATPAAPADTVAAVDETSVLADTAAPAAPTDDAPASAAATASPVPAASPMRLSRPAIRLPRPTCDGLGGCGRRSVRLGCPRGPADSGGLARHCGCLGGLDGPGCGHAPAAG